MEARSKEHRRSATKRPIDVEIGDFEFSGFFSFCNFDAVREKERRNFGKAPGGEPPHISGCGTEVLKAASKTQRR